MKTKPHRAFGVEQEHFIFDKNHVPPTPETIDRLWDCMVRNGYRIRGISSEGTILSIERITDDGPLVITNDSCTHIIETAFPKMNCLKRFRDLYETTWDDLRATLAQFGLKVQCGGALSEAPDVVHWRPKETDSKGDRLKKFLVRQPVDHPLFCQAFPACFAATHVSLDMHAEEALAKLPHFYANEYMIPAQFSTSKVFQGVRAQCVRLLAWLANFHQPYPLLGIPERFPATLDEYATMRTQCSGRDYSFVAIRDPNRLEFRSACSQNTVEDVLRLVRFRLHTDRQARSNDAGCASTAIRRFREACLSEAVVRQPQET